MIYKRLPNQKNKSRELRIVYVLIKKKKYEVGSIIVIKSKNRKVELLITLIKLDYIMQ